MKVADVTRGARVLASGNRRRKPKISIVTPTYKRNSEGLLARCLDSALGQTFTDFEYIIIDDGSSDGTEDVVREYALRDDRIVYVRHDANSGLPAVRTNEGVVRARGDAVAFLFDDNVFRPDFLEKAWEALQREQCDVVLSQVEMLTTTGKPFVLGGWPMTLELIRSLNTIPNGGVLVRRDFFDRYGLYDPHIVFRRVCDWDLWLRGMALGATFFSLEEVAATEYGLVSPNSLGNTIASDWKIVYSFMQDARIFADRSARLRPDVVEDFEVLDPTPVLPYVRDAGEWSAIVETFYDPYLAKHPRPGFDPRLPSNRSASIDCSQGWNADWALIRPKFRVLIVTNTVHAWASAWLNVLRQIPGAIVMNCPEWQLSAFQPPSLDLIILMDCTAPYVYPEVAKHKAAGVPVIYALGYGVQDQAGVAAASESDDIGRNSHIVDVVGAGAYFARPGVAFSDDQARIARDLATLATFVVARPDDAATINLSDVIVPTPEFAAPQIDAFVRGRDQVVYRTDALTAQGAERVRAPGDDLAGRISEESLGALVEARPGAAVLVEPTVLANLPPAERIGLGMLAATGGQAIVDASTAGSAKAPAFDAEEQARAAGLWEGWIANLARSARLVGALRQATPGEGRLRVAVLLNSEMIAGSEVYGVMIARNLARVGFDVEVLIPDCSPYGENADAGPLNEWLKQAGLRPAISAPFAYANRFEQFSPDERRAARAETDRFLTAGGYDVVICSAYMPALIDLPRRAYLMVVALFQPSAYRQSDLAALRGYVSAVISDSEWALTTSARVTGGPAKVVRSTTPFLLDRQAPRVHKDHVTPIRIAIGGTLQPRKRQAEAVAAVALLIKKGVRVVLNIYGHELGMMRDYIDALDKQISDAGAGLTIRRNGMQSLDVIAEQNDIVLSASVDESLPQTLAELMARGLIAVCGLSGGIDELVRDGETGYLTTDLSASGLAEALQRAIDDRQQWPARRRAAARLIEQDYSEAAATAALLELLLEAASIEAAPSGRLSAEAA